MTDRQGASSKEPPEIDLRKILESSSDGYMVTDADHLMLWANSAAHENLGLSFQTTGSFNLREFLEERIPGFDVSSLLAPGDRILSFLNKSGKGVRLRVSLAPLVDSQDLPDGFLVTIVESTEESLQRFRLNADLDFYRDVAFSVFDWVWETDASASFTRISEGVSKTLGYTPEELFGRTPFDYMEENEADRVVSTFNRISSRGRGFRDLENVVVASSGEKLTIATSGVPVWDSEGNLKGYRGGDRNVSAEVNSLRALEKDLALMAAATDAMPMGFFLTDDGGEVLHANRLACSVVNVQPEDLSGKNIMSFFSPSSREELTLPREPGKIVCEELKVSHKAGPAKLVKDSILAFSHSGRLFHLHKIVESVESPEEERHSAPAGRGKEFHDCVFRRIMDSLCGVAGTVEMLQRTSGAPADIVEALRGNCEALTDYLGYLRDASDFSEKEFTTEKEDFFLSTLLEDSLSPFLKRATAMGIRFSLECSEQDNRIWFGPARGIRTVLTLLLKNVRPLSRVFIGMCGTEDNSALRLSFLVNKPVAYSMNSDENPYYGNEAVIALCGRYIDEMGSVLGSEQLSNGGFRVWADIPIQFTEKAVFSTDTLKECHIVTATEKTGLARIWEELASLAGFQSSSAADSYWLYKRLQEREEAAGSTVVIADADSRLFSEDIFDEASGGKNGKLKSVKVVVLVSRLLAGDVEKYRRAGFSALLLKPLSVEKISSVVPEVVCSQRFVTDNFLHGSRSTPPC